MKNSLTLNFLMIFYNDLQKLDGRYGAERRHYVRMGNRQKFIKETYSTCADIVNQLVQRLNKEGINSYFLMLEAKEEI